MPTVEETINTIKDMGFSEDRAKKALNKTGWSGVEAAMEWLLSHPEGEDDEENEDEVEVVEEKKPLSEEEKQQKIKELEELRVKKRAEREAREKQEAIEREKKRMEDGKAMAKLKQEMNDQEMMKLAKERKREKKEAADAKRRVLEQIEADKRARQLEREAITKPEVQPEVVVVQEKKNYEETKLQIRLTDGKTLVQKFNAKEPLSAVRLYIKLNRSDGIDQSQQVKLMTSFPRKIFNEDDYEVPLDALGLVPSAVIIVSK